MITMREEGERQGRGRKRRKEEGRKRTERKE